MPLPGVLEQLYSYWQSLPRAEQSLVPARFNMLPTDINANIPRLSLLKVLSRYDVQVSMINTGQNEGWCGPFIGMNAFDLTAPHMRENSSRLYDNVLKQPCAAVMREEIQAKSGKARQICSLYLPLTDIEGKPRYILSCTDYRRKTLMNKSKVHDRILANHDHMVDIEFIDIGAGIPSAKFETLRPSQTTPMSHTWWDRFMPTLSGWFAGKPRQIEKATSNQGAKDHGRSKTDAPDTSTIRDDELRP